jgi:hypothetical protein
MVLIVQRFKGPGSFWSTLNKDRVRCFRITWSSRNIQTRFHCYVPKSYTHIESHYTFEFHWHRVTLKKDRVRCFHITWSSRNIQTRFHCYVPKSYTHIGSHYIFEWHRIHSYLSFLQRRNQVFPLTWIVQTRIFYHWISIIVTVIWQFYCSPGTMYGLSKLFLVLSIVLRTMMSLFTPLTQLLWSSIPSSGQGYHMIPSIVLDNNRLSKNNWNFPREQ